MSTLGSAFLAWSTARLAGGRPCAHMTHDSSEPEGKPLGIPPLEAQKFNRRLFVISTQTSLWCEMYKCTYSLISKMIADVTGWLPIQWP